MRSGRLLLACVAVIVASSAASAQTPTPDLKVALSGIAPSTDTNDTFYVAPYEVTVETKNFACPTDGGINVGTSAETVQAAGSNGSANASDVKFQFIPASLSVLVPAGQYFVAGFSKKVEGTLVVRPTIIPVGGLTVAVRVDARITGFDGQCTGLGQAPSPTTSSDFNVRFLRSTETVLAPPSPVMPGPSALVVIAAVALGFVVIRRRVGPV